MKKKVLIILGLIILIVMIFLYFLLKNDSEERSVFFLKTDNEKYLLYDEDGKRLSDIEYDNVMDYMLSSTLVYKDSKVSILDKKGNILVDDDAYDDIIRYASLYKATKNNKNYLLDNNGKVIKEIEDGKIISFKGENHYIIIENDRSFEIILYDGKEIYKFNKKDNLLPTVNKYEKLSSIYYDGLTIIFDNEKGDIKKKIEDNIQYCINEYKEDLIILNTCSSTYQDKISYKIIKNDDEIDISKTCNSISLKENNIVCESDNKEYLLDDNLKKALELDNHISYIDYENYIKGYDDKVEFYKDGKKVKTIDKAKIKSNGYHNDEYYILEIDKLSYYYNSEGKRVIDEGFKVANPFDSNSLALVSNNDKEYLIDREGNKILEEMDRIAAYSDFYIISSSSYGILNKKGKKILEPIYDGIKIIANSDCNYAILTKSKEYYMYDIDNEKIIAKYNSEIETFNSYYKVGNKYYTYNGKEIYQTK